MKIDKYSKVKKNVPADIIAVKNHYDYWDNFIEEWGKLAGTTPMPSSFSGFPHLSDWTYPKAIIGSSKPPIETINYLPEPWWGNDGSHPLSAVVINLNPGSASARQRIGKLKMPMIYSDFIKGTVSNYVTNTRPVTFKSTNNWHYHDRALPIFEALDLNGIKLLGADKLHNILSLELVPWHTQRWSNLGTYPKDNAEAIFKHIIKFAAEASRCITPQKLNGFVIVRASHDTIKDIFSSKYHIDEIQAPTNVVGSRNLICAKYSIIRFLHQGIDDVKFLLIWKYKSLGNNDFPHCSDLIRIIQNI